MFRKPRKTMGKRGFHVDWHKTNTRQPAFESKWSFVSRDGHEILHGGDKTARRREIFDRSHGRCELHIAPGCKGFVNWNSRDLEGWAHLDIEPHRNHCDCAANGAASCDPCHRYWHSHSKLAREILRRRNEAKQLFDQVHQETT
jgi:hypothetical protein